MSRDSGPFPAFRRGISTTLFLYVVALTIRLVNNFYGVFTPQGIVPFGTDSFYHMRRITWATEHGLRVLDFDRYLNFPAGAHAYWTYGFDWVYALVARLTTPLRADPWWTYAAAVVLTPCLSAVTPCLTRRIGETVGQPRAGLWAAGLLAVLPAVTITGSIGYTDHHVFESLCFALYAWGYVSALNEFETDPSRARRRAGWSGAAVTVGLLCTTVFPAMLPAHVGLLIAQLAHVRSRRPAFLGALLDLNSRLWLTATVLLAPFAATRMAEPNGVNPALQVSWLACAGLFLASTAGGWIVDRKTASDRRATHRLGLVLGAAIVLVVLFRIEYGALLGFVKYGVGHVLRHDPWVAAVQENQPLWAFPAGFVLWMYSGFLVVWPLVALWMLARGWKQSLAWWSLAVWGAGTAILALLQTRLCGLFAVPYVLAFGFAVEGVRARLQSPEDGTSSRKIAVLRIACAVFLIALLWPTLERLTRRRAVIGSESDLFVRLHPTLEWIRGHTPPTSPLADQPTDYAIAADWIVGHYIVALAERPVLSSPMEHTQPHREGIREAAAIFMLSPDEARKRMDARRVRYVLFTNLQTNHLLDVACWDEATNSVRLPADRISMIRNGFYLRLMNDAVPGGRPDADVLRRLRLIRETYPNPGAPGMWTKRIALFERVPGAELFGQAEPTAEVRVSARLRTAEGREIAWSDLVTADASGKFSLVVPYASGQNPDSEVEMLGPYRVESGDKTADVSVPDTEIRSGGRREIRLAPSSESALQTESRDRRP